VKWPYLRRVDAGHTGPGGGLNGLGVLPGTLVEAYASYVYFCVRIYIYIHTYIHTHVLSSYKYDSIVYMSNRQNSLILRYVLAGHWFSESAKN
jgi:hypothetical protein